MASNKLAVGDSTPESSSDREMVGGEEFGSRTLRWLAKQRLRLTYRDGMSELSTTLTCSLPSEVCASLIAEGHATEGRDGSHAAIPDALMMGLIVVGSSADIVTLTNLPAALSAVSRFVRGIRGDEERYMKVKGPGGEATIRIRDGLSGSAVTEIVSAVWSAD